MNREHQTRKKIIKNLPHFWMYAIGSGVIALLLQLISLIPSLIMQRIVDRYIPEGNLKKIAIGIIWFILLPILSTGMSAFYKCRVAVVCRDFGQRLMLVGFRKIMAQPLSFFEERNSAELTTYCRKEAVQYINFWIAGIPGLVASLLQGIVIFLALLRINLWTALIALLYFPVAYFPCSYFGKKSQQLGKGIIESNGKMSQIITDTFRDMKFVRTMGIEEERVKSLRSVSDHAMTFWSKLAFLDNMTFLWVNNLANALFVGLIFAVGAFFAVTGKTTVGQLIVLLNYAGLFFAAAQKAMHTNYNFRAKLGEYDQLFELLTLPVPAEEGCRICAFRKEIQFQSVSFSYQPDRPQVLKDLSFSVKKGEFLGLVGQSGAGKTTIFDLLMRLYTPQGGSILLDGVSLSEYTTESLRKEITKVSQETVLFPGTIRENLLLANAAATEEQCMEVLDQVALKQFVTELPQGLDTVIGESGLMLSGGERQRLGLAQGLLRESRILLVDEVTANVDQESERIIRIALCTLVREKQVTVLAISHRPEFLSDSDRILVLEDGKIAEETTFFKRYGEK